MAINLASDLVMEVARAADPLKVKAAEARLLAAEAAGAPASFTGGLDAAACAAEQLSAPVTGLPQIARQLPLAQKFEAAVATTFIEYMMPKEAPAVFGESLSGSVCKTFLAEAIAASLAAKGTFGIGKTIERAISAGEA